MHSYLCENYDPSHRLIPTERAARAKVREWMAASEGTFMIHALAVLYARWRMPEAGKKDLLPEMEKEGRREDRAFPVMFASSQPRSTENYLDSHKPWCLQGQERDLGDRLLRDLRDDHRNDE